jgi:hypothetical protein
LLLTTFAPLSEAVGFYLEDDTKEHFAHVRLSL